MDSIASQITSLTIVYSNVYSGADQSKHQSSASLAFVWGIHRGPVNSPHKWPVTRKIFPFDDVIMIFSTGLADIQVYRMQEDVGSVATLDPRHYQFHELTFRSCALTRHQVGPAPPMLCPWFVGCAPGERLVFYPTGLHVCRDGRLQASRDRVQMGRPILTVLLQTLLLTWIKFIFPAWVGNYIHYGVWDEITYPNPHFNGVEVWDWMNNCTLYCTGHAITYPHWD